MSNYSKSEFKYVMKTGKIFSTLIILCSVMSPIASAYMKEDIWGTWISISHQTITVTHYKKDGTFSGTYFTPAFDVKTTFSGKWTLSNDELILHYLESSSPILKIPSQDRNQLIVKDKNTILLKTLPEGIQIEATRVKFKDRREVYPDWGITNKSKTEQKVKSDTAEPHR